MRAMSIAPSIPILSWNLVRNIIRVILCYREIYFTEITKISKRAFSINFFSTIFFIMYILFHCRILIYKAKHIRINVIFDVGITNSSKIRT